MPRYVEIRPGAGKAALLSSAGQCYVVDLFLWHMARHGYVLRKADKDLPFDDIEKTNADAKAAANKAMASALGLKPAQ